MLECFFLKEVLNTRWSRIEIDHHSVTMVTAESQGLCSLLPNFSDPGAVQTLDRISIRTMHVVHLVLGKLPVTCCMQYFVYISVTIT